MRHPARAILFGKLIDRLTEEVEAGNVNVSVDKEASLSLFCYSKSCVYDRAWSPISEMARGLILDTNSLQVVATPFPKFFNVSERENAIPAMPFEVFEKLDGSMITIFWHRGRWRTATKGSLRSDQAIWAQAEIDKYDLSTLRPGTTYVCEAIYPENRIVIQYDYFGLVLLAAYDALGFELAYEEIKAIGDRIGWRTAVRYDYPDIAGMLTAAKELPATAEGWVLRFENGHRLKIKGDEYLRLHRMVSRLTPLAIWESMAAGDDLVSFRRELPEEFWPDFDSIFDILFKKVNRIVADTAKALADARQGQDLTDKDVGLMLTKFPAHVRRFIFPFRHYGGNLFQGRIRTVLYRQVRPTGNRLEGYVPSGSVNRVLEEA